VASVLLALEKISEDKHVESLLIPCLDEGSTPSSSTFNKGKDAKKQRHKENYFKKLCAFAF